MEWWNDLRMLVARYLVASEAIERSGPVAAAVRSAGYLSEEEDEDEGSSIEEEDNEDEDEDDHYHVVPDHLAHDEAVPAYSHPGKESGIEVGPGGYVVRICTFSLFVYLWHSRYSLRPLRRSTRREKT